MEKHLLLQREAARRQTALRILKELQLLERWQVYGKPYLVGAVSYGLVVAPDIDLEVYCPDTPRIDEGFAVMAACAGHPGIRQVKFSNRLQDEDQGLYWQLRYLNEDGMEWKVDMWSMGYDYPGPASRDMVEPMQRCLTVDTRAAILEIKEQLLAQPDPAASAQRRPSGHGQEFARRLFRHAGFVLPETRRPAGHGVHPALPL